MMDLHKNGQILINANIYVFIPIFIYLLKNYQK